MGSLSTHSSMDSTINILLKHSSTPTLVKMDSLSTHSSMPALVRMDSLSTHSSMLALESDDDVSDNNDEYSKLEYEKAREEYLTHKFFIHVMTAI